MEVKTFWFSIVLEKISFLISASGDDPMDETYAGKTSGAFQLWGCASDPIGHIDPELHLYHNCKGEERRVKLIIPEAAIGKEYNYTEIINLDGTFQNDEKKKSPAKKCTTAAKKPKFYFF